MEISKIKEEYFSAEQLSWLEQNIQDPVIIIDLEESTIMRQIIRLDTSGYITSIGDHHFDNSFTVYSITPTVPVVSFFVWSSWLDSHPELPREAYAGYIVDRWVAEKLQADGLSAVDDLLLQYLFRNF